MSKSKIWTRLFALLPGAGHMYIGAATRGLQLQLSFFGAIALTAMTEVPLFGFLIPIVWCYSFFDAWRQWDDYEAGLLFDEPIFKSWQWNNRLVAYGLMALGVYLLFDQFVLPLLDTVVSRFFAQASNWMWQMKSYLQTIILSFIFIIGGFRILAGQRKGDDFE